MRDMDCQRALGFESRVRIRVTKVQRGPRRTLLVNEDEPRAGLPVSTKTASAPQTMKPTAAAVAAQRLISHDHISGVVASRLGFSPERETSLTRIHWKVHSSSVAGIDYIEGSPRCSKCLARPEPAKVQEKIENTCTSELTAFSCPWYMRETDGPILGRAHGYVDPTKQEKVWSPFRAGPPCQ
jgi:hypothetical protein